MRYLNGTLPMWLEWLTCDGSALVLIETELWDTFGASGFFTASNAFNGRPEFWRMARDLDCSVTCSYARATVAYSSVLAESALLLLILMFAIGGLNSTLLLAAGGGLLVRVCTIIKPWLVAMLVHDYWSSIMLSCCKLLSL